MNVVFLCRADDANECYIFSKCLKLVGVNAIAFSRGRHPYYSEQAIRFKIISEVIPSVRKADVLIFGFSQYIETGVNLSKKVVGVLHGGSRYRQNHEQINKLFNSFVDVTFSGSDMCGLGAKKEICIFSAVDSTLLQPVYNDFTNRKRIVAHYPSRNKGSDIIKKVIEKLQKDIDFEFAYSTEVVPFSKQVERMSECDIYIENMETHQKGVLLTTFGRTTLEAASLGKVVCTRFLDLEIYKKSFPECAIQTSNDSFELESKLRFLLTCSDETLRQLQKESRDWIEKYHSLQAMGMWWKQTLEKCINRKMKGR